MGSLADFGLERMDPNWARSSFLKFLMGYTTGKPKSFVSCCDRRCRELVEVAEAAVLAVVLAAVVAAVAVGTLI
jgi:hypothetical protein